MAKTPVRDTNGKTVPGLQAQPAQVQLTAENSLMYLAKFTEMMVVELRAVEIQIKLAVFGRQFHDLDALDQFLARAPVPDEIGHRANFQPVPPGEFL